MSEPQNQTPNEQGRSSLVGKLVGWALILGLIAMLTWPVFIEFIPFPKGIKKYPEQWVARPTGAPLEEYPTPRILRQGSGNVVKVGDMVQVRFTNRYEDKPLKEKGTWWIWLGFLAQDRDKTNYYTRQSADLFENHSAMLGMQEGTVYHFPERDKVKFDDDGKKSSFTSVWGGYQCNRRSNYV